MTDTNKPSTSIRYNIFLLLCLSASYYTVSHRLSDVLKANNLLPACKVTVTVIAMLSTVISLIALKIKNEKQIKIMRVVNTVNTIPMAVYWYCVDNIQRKYYSIFTRDEILFLDFANSAILFLVVYCVFSVIIWLRNKIKKQNN